MKNRMLRIAGATILGCSALIALFFAYIHFTHSEPKYTLREALWVSDREMKNFYPPFSRESQDIIKVLEEIRFDPDKKAYDNYVLYRMGLTTSDVSTEKVLIMGFKPPK
jgi:hypothetical protein